MKLYIAEKPSLGRAIANALPKPHQQHPGYIQVGNGDCVSWCIGHLLEQAEPDAYDPRFKKWSQDDLPIIPEQWKLVPKPNTKSQLSVLRKLTKAADQLVHAGDPDREGQLLVDQVISYLGVKGAKKEGVQRLLINDLNQGSIAKALRQQRPNHELMPLSTSALARSRADWLYGINLTRLCTLRGQKSGYQGVLSIGRVQTPVLGLVVKRDQAIEAFVAKPFYELDVSLKTRQGYCFKAKWQPSEACLAYADEDGRILSRRLVENVASRVLNQTGTIKRFQANNKQQPPPLPYNLSALQIDAAKQFGLSAKQVLDICQQLYERHKAITYPRSDCRYLPGDHFKEANQVIAAITHTNNSLDTIIAACDITRQSKAWNDKKVDAHHAIIPTSKRLNQEQLHPQERQIYQLIARQYVMQFMDNFKYRHIKIDVDINGGLFTATRNETQTLGWKAALPKPSKANHNDHAEEPPASVMPVLQTGESVHCFDTHILDKTTTPPKHFTDASLMSAMTGIARYVTDSTIRKILRDTDGLGTEATRAGIIELLFTRGFLTRKGKEIHATDIGRQLINSLPQSISAPDMTAQWEAQLNDISQRHLAYSRFISTMTNTLEQLITGLSNLQLRGLAGKGQKPKKRRFKKTTKGSGKKTPSTRKKAVGF